MGGAVACARAPETDPATPAQSVATSDTPSPNSAPEPEAGSEAPEEPKNLAPEPEVLFSAGVFPPADPGAPFERSRHEGDGVFRPVFADSPDLDRNKRSEKTTLPDFGEAWSRRMVLHPHESSRFQKLTVAAFDLRYLSAMHIAGAQDVLDVGRADLEPRAGLVPATEHVDLFAVFNGGFQPRHGRWGMLSLGEQLIPPREDGCTVAVLKDGTVRVGPWSELKTDTAVHAYRQTPPCLVTDGAVHPKLQKGDRKDWAGQNKDLKTQRRSAVGVSKDGRTLFYGLGAETEAETLAAGMLHAGAHQAAQLDINWNWTRLFFFQDIGGEVKPVGALEEHMAKDKGEYVYRSGKRGFFYLVRRGPH